MKKKSRVILLLAAAFIVILFAAVTVRTAEDTYNSRVEDESFEQPDFYSMSEYSASNSKVVMDALRSGNTKKLEKLMKNTEGLEDVIAFADWSQADFDSAVSMGAGSLTPKPNGAGRQDVSERFFVDCGGSRYVFFIETLTSRYGLKNEGITAVAVIDFDTFDALGFAWNGEKNDSSVLAGELYWNQ